MKTIDRLIIKAKKKCGVDKLIVAFVYPSEEDPHKWIARGDIWNGHQGSGVTQIISKCETMEEAIAVLQDLGEKYPNNKDVPIFINDVGDESEEENRKTTRISKTGP